ncbi:cytochrome b N-terminal domain-containing protein [Gluconobacter sphaericus]|uniref:cytochrome b n=1 Tax=Gluconobacter sphaericus TaxID=574987 RepID=UPI0019224F93|nr:cytochrome b N-terminal domain-containing protein [Gluconobacter sphaericus]QQX91688.1 cytochrome b N-terminal domain-containing protein [Gluconobacter sphaericus]
MPSPNRTPDTEPPGWLEHRLPVMSLLRHHYVAFPMPRNLNALWSFGAFLIVTMAFMVASGLFLAINYTPDITQAFASVEAIDRQIPSGWFIRSLHMGGVTMLFGCLYIHIGRSLWYGSYKAPRELLWLTGLGLMLMVMVTAFAGYVLPWGQMSYWGATVILNAVHAVPVIGQPLSELLLGGDTLGNVALHRLFVLHFTMAFAILGVIALHVAALHVVKSNNPSGVDPVSPKQTLPFHPYYTSRDGFALCLFLMVYAGLVFFLPDLLTLADNYVQANPLVTPRDIRPEWYFAPFYAILRAVPSRLGGLLLASGSLAVLFVLPWLDRSAIRPAAQRPMVRMSLHLAFAAFILLGITGMHAPTPAWLLASRVAIAWWFIHFLLVTPLASEREISS